MGKKILNVTLLTLLLCNLAFSKTGLYKVSLIAFTHINNNTLQAETWTNELLKPNLKNTIPLKPTISINQNEASVDIINNYQILTEDQTGLNNAASRISNQPDYKIIKHISWIQPINDSKSMKWINIIGGQIYDENGQPINETEVSYENTNDNYYAKIPTYWELNGKIKLTKSRYFNISTMLYLTLPKSVYGGFGNYSSGKEFYPVPLQSFELIQAHRTQLNKLIYFDHPLFGVLINIEQIKNNPISTIS